MRDWKLALCVALFLLLSALRLCFPAEAALAQRLAADTLDPRHSYRAIAIELGRDLEAFDAPGRLVAVFGRVREALP